MGFWSFAVIAMAFFGGIAALLIGAVIVVGIYIEFQVSRGKVPFQ